MHEYDDSPYGPADPSDRHHSRVRSIGLAVWFALAGFAVVAWVWFVFRAGVCWGELPLMWHVVCTYSFVVPTALGMLLIGATPLVALVLIIHGRELDERKGVPAPDATMMRAVHHTRIGYRALRPSHRSHVHRTMLFSAAGVGAFVGFAVFLFQWPALAAMLLGAAPVLAIWGLNRFWLEQNMGAEHLTS